VIPGPAPAVPRLIPPAPLPGAPLPGGPEPGRRLPAPAGPPPPTGPPAASPSFGHDPGQATRRHLRLTSMAACVCALAGIAAILWLVHLDDSSGDIYLAVTVGLVAALVVDATAANGALGRLRIHLQGRPEAAALEPLDWIVRIDGARRPVTISSALFQASPKVLVDGPEPGRIHLPGLPRGAVSSLVLDATSGGPLGLCEAGRRYRVPLPVPVHVGPRRQRFTIEWPKPRAVAFGLAQGAPLGDDLVRSVRPYLRGDERRRVHWPSTAHHGDLMVRENDGTGVAALQVVADLGPPGANAEITAAAAAFLTEQAIARGWVVHLVTLQAAPTPPFRGPLGSPFGPAAMPWAMAPTTGTPVSRRVRSARAVSHALATAAPGTPAAPEFPGVTCRVTQKGLVWG
jgi:hypothetical protein